MMLEPEGRTDEDLMRYLTAAHLTYIPAREGGWDTIKEWKDVFSGGEKQRVRWDGVCGERVALSLLNVIILFVVFDRSAWRASFTTGRGSPSSTSVRPDLSARPRRKRKIDQWAGKLTRTDHCARHERGERRRRGVDVRARQGRRHQYVRAT